MDIVVTVPKREYSNNVREREYARNNPNAVGFRLFPFKPDVQTGDRIYFVRDGMVSYSKTIIAVKQADSAVCDVTGRRWTGRYQVLFMGERDEKCLGIKCKGFRGVRYRWWR